MIRFTTAYECPKCQQMYTRKEALHAGPLVACIECGKLHPGGFFYGYCEECECEKYKVVSKMACGGNCAVTLRPLRVLWITNRERYSGTAQETEDGSLLVRVTTADLKRIAAEAAKQGVPSAGDST
jgi:hypothetical protein